MAYAVRFARESVSRGLDTLKHRYLIDDSLKKIDINLSFLFVMKKIILKTESEYMRFKKVLLSVENLNDIDPKDFLNLSAKEISESFNRLDAVHTDIDFIRKICFNGFCAGIVNHSLNKNDRRKMLDALNDDINFIILCREKIESSIQSLQYLKNKEHQRVFDSKKEDELLSTIIFFVYFFLLYLIFYLSIISHIWKLIKRYR